MRVLLTVCFFFISHVFRCCFIAISHREPHKKLLEKASHKLKKVEKDCFKVGRLHLTILAILRKQPCLSMLLT